MQISNRANGYSPERELNKDLRLTFSNGYTTEVNKLIQLLKTCIGTGHSKKWHTVVTFMDATQIDEKNIYHMLLNLALYQSLH